MTLLSQNNLLECYNELSVCISHVLSQSSSVLDLIGLTVTSNFSPSIGLYYNRNIVRKPNSRAIATVFPLIEDTGLHWNNAVRPPASIRDPACI